MKLAAGILLFFFSFLTVQPLLSIAGSILEKKEACIMPCCSHHKEKKTPTPAKGMCGDMSCNPFGEYACCTGFIVSDKTHFNFVLENVRGTHVLFTQSYSSNFVCDCWRPPENTVSIPG